MVKGIVHEADRPGVVPNNQVVRSQYFLPVHIQCCGQCLHVLVDGGEVERGLVPDQTMAKDDVNCTGWHCSVHQG